MRQSPPGAARNIAAALALLGSANAGAELLYDASLNTLPAVQSWSSAIAPGVTSAASGGAYSLDTTSSALFQSGHVRMLGAGTLNTQAGFELGIGLNVLSESHSTTDRAGFSLLFVGDTQTHALELGFWADSVWAYGITSGAFVHGSSATVSTAGFHDYRVRVRNDAYTLFRDGVQILSGTLVDYPSSPSNPQTLVYDTPNAAFLGDDTSRAAASVQIKYVSLAPVPLPGALLVFAPALGALISVRRR